MNDYLALAEKSAETDLPFLLKVKEETKKRMNENSTQENINAFNRARDSVDAEIARRSAPAPRAFRTQTEAVDFLAASGFKLSNAKLSRDLKGGKLSTNTAGHYEEGSLLAYAAVHLKPRAQVESRAAVDAATERIVADTRLKDAAAARAELKLAKEQGLLMPRTEHSRELAARALFFKREVENFIYLHGGSIIHEVGGDEARLPDLIRFWAGVTADWMNTWAEEREFTAREEADEEAGQAAEDKDLLP